MEPWTDVHRRGGMGGDVENRVEGGESQRAHGRQVGNVIAQRLPVAADVPVGEDQHQQHRTEPAQGHQEHGRDLADGETAEYRVGAPAERGQRQQYVSPSARLGVRHVIRPDGYSAA